MFSVTLAAVAPQAAKRGIRVNVDRLTSEHWQKLILRERAFKLTAEVQPTKDATFYRALKGLQSMVSVWGPWGDCLAAKFASDSSHGVS